ncbi:DUF4112 domain-containing protein [Rivularia sp. UHCC 0363]|uniref:DUF4112 domain-containing protein n=1 Tax=Rivularia sp. UHCC 0363 TaxID=3110244 RepID=UPI002B20F846|nr:DUF4112 domain-containing protein [Rivularia sp. UHCC 0363]MEA5596724.1 DUF4112 domain-containing protein [Rivularia sp. UHCC 0363]
MDIKKSLPVKIEAHEASLIQTKNEIQKFIKVSEGLIYDQVGLDACLGLIPVAGGMYTGIMGIWLLSQSYKVRADNEDKLMIVALTFVDLVVGIVPIFGDILDAFLRVHALNGNRLITHIDKQLLLIENTREQLNQGFDLDLNALENILLG